MREPTKAEKRKIKTALASTIKALKHTQSLMVDAKQFDSGAYANMEQALLKLEQAA